jgi:indole-3-glycerol phosphate synthase
MRLHSILRDTEKEIAAAKRLRSIGDLKRMIRDTPPVRSFKNALGKGFGIIAEIKHSSPSAGMMRPENFEQAPSAYAKSPIVRAVSVLTNFTHFGMRIEDLMRVKELVHQPILRKDFISKEYQVYEARAFGADAILLMANVLKREQLQKLFDLAREYQLEVLFESHTSEEIRSIPLGAEIYGINSRKFMASKRWIFANLKNRLGFGKSGKGIDPTVELDIFSQLFNELPKNAIKVAESGIKPSKVSAIMDLGYDSVLVGTSLLKAQEGVQAALATFEQAISPSVRNVPGLSFPIPA